MKLKSTKQLKATFFLSLCFAAQTSFSQQIGNGYEPMITDFNQPLLSGGYSSGSVPFTGATPDVSNTWTHLFTIRHINAANNNQLQIASTYSMNDRLFFRKLAGVGPINQAWTEMATRGGNTFIGNQNIIGVLKTDNEIISTKAAGYAQFRAVGGNYGLLLGNDGVNSGFLLTASGNQYGMWNGLRPFGINNATGDVTIGNSAMTISHSTGKVIIGVPDFTKTNEPNCKLFVAGGIVTEKVKVMTYANWADYVFADDYKLTPLKEVEKFISENKHLPNIPSAKDVKEQGLDIAEMQAKQMEKIEELTLYIIQMNKEMATLKNEIEALR